METQNHNRQITEPSTEKEKKLREALRFYQGFILDGLELNFGDDPAWPSARRTVLKAFGDNGLEKKLREII